MSFDSWPDHPGQSKSSEKGDQSDKRFLKASKAQALLSPLCNLDPCCRHLDASKGDMQLCTFEFVASAYQYFWRSIPWGGLFNLLLPAIVLAALIQWMLQIRYIDLKLHRKTWHSSVKPDGYQFI